MRGDFSITKQTKDKIPRLPLLCMKNDILGNEYSLSIVFANKSTSQKLNKKFRHKDKPTNILSFPLTQKSGEIILCPSVIRSETKNKEKTFGKDFQGFLGFLIIHGMLHLKGHKHGSVMEKEEKKYLSRTKF
jgi:probable rRNA maturation factor